MLRLALIPATPDSRGAQHDRVGGFQGKLSPLPGTAISCTAAFLIKITISIFDFMPALRNSRPGTKRKRAQTAGRGGAAREKIKPPLIRCVIFDLDDTLYDCFKQRVRVAHRHA